MGCAEPEFVDSAACGYRALREQYLTLLTRDDETNSGVSNDFVASREQRRNDATRPGRSVDSGRPLQARPLAVRQVVADQGDRRKAAEGTSKSSPILQNIASEPIPASRATSRNRQKAFASFICLGLWQSGSKRRGLPTTMHAHCARDVATLKRLGL